MQLGVSTETRQAADRTQTSDQASTPSSYREFVSCPTEAPRSRPKSVLGANARPVRSASVDSLGQRMAEQPSKISGKGLATVAMLKVNFDRGQDHIGMFEPFVLDAIGHLNATDFDVDAIRQVVRDRHDMQLPEATTRLLLQRVARSKALRREGGRYFRTDADIAVPDLRAERLRAEERQRRLASAVRAAGNRHGLDLESDEAALQLVLTFLEYEHVALAIHESPTAERLSQEDPGQRIALTAICLEEVIADPGLADVLQEMLEGFVLQNTLLLKDITTATRRFKDLTVYLDSQVVFGALGLRGKPMQTAVIELLDLLRGTGAKLGVFDKTLREMRAVLTLYEDRLGTAQGRQTLYRTDLTRHILAARLTPSDMRLAISTLEIDVKQMGVDVQPTPSRERRWTYDEQKLAAILTEPGKKPTEPRVVHDVDCIAAVLSLRRGHVGSLDDAVAVFATSSSMTVRNARRWYDEEVGRGAPPIVHYLALSNFAWLKRPASAARLKLHELVALCGVAIRPSPAAWSAFVKHLEKLRASKTLTDDEAVAIIASSLTDRCLVEADIDDDPDASSMSEVVERVKASYKESSEQDVATARTEARASGADEMVRRVETRVGRFARRLSWVAVVLVGACLLIGTGLSIAQALGGDSPGRLAVTLTLVPLILVGLLGAFTGFHLSAWRRSLEARIATALADWLIRE